MTWNMTWNGVRTLITVENYCKMFDYDENQVWKLVLSGVLSAEQHGGVYLIDIRDAENVVPDVISALR